MSDNLSKSTPLERSIAELPESDLVDFIKQTANKAHKSYKMSVKSADAEIDAGLTSRKKQVTLTSRAWNDREAFNLDIKHLKFALRRIL